MNRFHEVLHESATPSRSSKPCETLRRRLLRESGQDSVEFALLSSWVSVAAILALEALGPLVVQTYRAVYFVLLNVRADYF